jgi:hypothetical protein
LGTIASGSEFHHTHCKTSSRNTGTSKESLNGGGVSPRLSGFHRIASQNESAHDAGGPAASSFLIDSDQFVSSLDDMTD